MNEREMKKAFDEIEPEAGAQERMFANILKKAAAQEAHCTQYRKNQAQQTDKNG